MSKRKSNPRRTRRVIVRGVRRGEVDIPKLSRALLALITAQAEAEAQNAHEARLAEERRKEAS
jgi:hypothetical protein